MLPLQKEHFKNECSQGKKLINLKKTLIQKSMLIHYLEMAEIVKVNQNEYGWLLPWPTERISDSLVKHLTLNTAHFTQRIPGLQVKLLTG